MCYCKGSSSYQFQFEVYNYIEVPYIIIIQGAADRALHVTQVCKIIFRDAEGLPAFIVLPHQTVRLSR